MEGNFWTMVPLIFKFFHLPFGRKDGLRKKMVPQRQLYNFVATVQRSILRRPIRNDVYIQKTRNRPSLCIKEIPEIGESTLGSYYRNSCYQTEGNSRKLARVLWFHYRNSCYQTESEWSRLKEMEPGMSNGKDRTVQYAALRE